MEINQLAAKIQGIGQTGLHYTKDVYDKERYEELIELAWDLLVNYSDASADEIKIFLNHEEGYATPKIDVRAVILNAHKKILLVKEVTDKSWSLPGGWGDIGYSPKEVAEKEVLEEAGIRVKATRLLQVMDKAKHDFPKDVFYVYKFFIQCELLEEDIHTGIETLDVGFFTIEECRNLSLSKERITLGTLEKMYQQALNNQNLADCD